MNTCTDCFTTEGRIEQCDDLQVRCSLCETYRTCPGLARNFFARNRTRVPPVIVQLLGLDRPDCQTAGRKDIELPCVACHGQFWFYVGEQLAYGEQGLEPPTHCPKCRAKFQCMPAAPTKNDPNIIDVTSEHRQHVAGRLKVKQGIRSDLLREIGLILRDDLRVTERAVRIRDVMAAFEVDEEVLPDEAAEILKVAERMRLHG